MRMHRGVVYLHSIVDQFLSFLRNLHTEFHQGCDSMYSSKSKCLHFLIVTNKAAMNLSVLFLFYETGFPCIADLKHFTVFLL